MNSVQNVLLSDIFPDFPFVCERLPRVFFPERHFASIGNCCLPFFRIDESSERVLDSSLIGQSVNRIIGDSGGL